MCLTARSQLKTCRLADLRREPNNKNAWNILSLSSSGLEFHE